MDPIESFEQFFKERYYEQLLSIASEYPQQKSLLVNYNDLDKFDVELADALLKNPEETIKQAKDAISEIELSMEVKGEINVRFFNLPSSQCINIRDIRAEHIDKFVTLEGIVKSAADVRPEAMRITFECPECRHEMVIHQSGKLLKTPYICENATCTRRGRFKQTKVDLIDVQRIKIQEPPELIIGGEQPATLGVYLCDDLVSPNERKKVTPGNRVKITGILRKVQTDTRTGLPTPKYDLFLDSNYVEAVEREFEEIELSKEDITEIKKFSKDPKLYEKFVQSIAPSIYGYDEIKEAILLQLFGGVQKIQPDGTKIRGDIHIFLIGDPAVGKSQLLWYIANLAPKGRFVSGKKASGVGLTAAIVRDEFAGWTLEAGALILANNGVVAVDEFDKMGEEDRSAMLEGMEQGTISIAKAGIVTTLKANTSVLAAANPKYGRFDKYKPITEQIDLSPVILSRFDLKFPIQDIPNKERDVALAEHVLGSFTNPKTIAPVITPEVIRKYVAYAKRNCVPVLTKEAKDIITNFYINWRSKYIEGGEGSTVALTPRQLEALIRLSAASAKVMLRNRITAEDARRAVRLLELSLKELGTEPETGKIDIDRIEAGVSSMQRSKIYTILSIIDELSVKVGKSVLIEDIIAEAKERGIDDISAREVLEQLKRKGDLFEPKPDYIQKA